MRTEGKKLVVPNTSLIDGRTLHSALKLKIRRARGSGDAEVLELDWSASDRKHIEEVFGPAHIILLDEFSMASLKLLAQLDAGTRMAKQNFDDFFGGMAVVLSGDLCQYAPVREKAVYCPVSNLAAKNPTNASLNRMGRLAYKSFATVIEFSQQQRMSADPRFAAAVNRLRVRECVHSDVLLFNTRVMKSATRPNGVDMSLPEMNDACVISATNRTRMQINTAKARSLGFGLSSYIEISACDSLRGSGQVIEMTPALRTRLLDLQLPPTQLPGRLNYFVGMPVIMRRRNLSVGLKATNGAQGRLRQVVHGVDQFGEKTPRLALIKIPDSAVDLDRLRPGIFPVAPQTSAFSVILRDEVSSSDQRLSVSRSQLAVEPAFCITGHIAQGRTLPKVVADPATRRSGFYLYVSISRARCLDDIVFVRDVSLEDLNEPLPQPLRFELLRLSVLAHNTAVGCGDLDAPLKKVPVHEMERAKGSGIRMLDTRDGPAGTAAIGKRKRQATVGSEAAAPFPTPAKRMRGSRVATERSIGIREGQKSTILALNRQAAALRQRAHAGLDAGPLNDSAKTSSVDTNPAQATKHLEEDGSRVPPVLCGPTWDSVNWSCAYDAVFMTMWFAWRQMSPAAKSQWRSFSSTSALLAHAYDALMLQPADGAVAVDVFRDRFRRLLVMLDPMSFPAAPGAQADLFQLLLVCTRAAAEIDVPDTAFDLRFACRRCGSVLLEEEFYLASHVDSLRGTNEFSLAQWLSARLFGPPGETIPLLPPCCPNRTLALTFENLPPMLVFLIDPQLAVTNRTRISMSSSSGIRVYRLVSVVYVTPRQPAHFSARLIEDGSAWFYDSQIQGGLLQLQGHASMIEHFNTHGDNKSCALVYALT